MDLARLLGRESTGEAFIAEEKGTTLRPLWDLWRGPQAEWFPTIRFGVVAASSYANGLKRFLSGEMGMQCLFSHTTEETDNNALRKTLANSQPQFFFGRIVDKIYLAELDSKTRFIPAGFPGPIVRRALGTPFMGHSGAVFLLQEIVNALYDMLFNFLPLNRQSEATETHTQKARMERRSKSAPQRSRQKSSLHQPDIIRSRTQKESRTARVPPRPKHRHKRNGIACSVIWDFLGNNEYYQNPLYGTGVTAPILKNLTAHHHAERIFR